MGRLCRRAHEISGIPTPICLGGWVAGGFMGGGGGVGYVLVRGWGDVLVKGGGG